MSVTIRESKIGKGRMLWATALIAIIAIAVLTIFFARDIVSVTVPNGEVTVQINEGEGMSETVNVMENEDIIEYPIIFKLYARLGGYAENIQPGAVTVKDKMSYGEILELLITPNRSAERIVIPEGYEIRQIAETLCEAGVADWNRFYDALNNDEYNYRFLENLPDRENKMEGYLFPATYEIPEGMSEHDIINLMLEAFDNQFKDEYYQKAAEMNMTIDEIITMASIIERETDSEAERAKVAGVFYNRINSGMKLQSCATVQYILGERKSVLSIADTKIDSFYNTYLYAGFPLGPICNPGIACIEAALYPESTDAYYFVQGSDGKHIFSKTYEEHLNAMKNSDPAMSVDSTAIENQDSMIGAN